MTRINVVEPKELCDQHLLAEWRELTRIPNSLISGKLKIQNIPKAYTVRTEDNPSGGQGHVKFFIDKLKYLSNRYKSLLLELQIRNMPQKDYWPHTTTFPEHLCKDYIPTVEAIALNRRRIKERTPKSSRYYGI
jgi:hypothetical protein